MSETSPKYEFNWNVLEHTKYLYAPWVLVLTSDDFVISLSETQKLVFSTRLEMKEKFHFWGRKTSVVGKSLWIDWKSIPAGVEKIIVTLSQPQSCLPNKTNTLVVADVCNFRNRASAMSLETNNKNLHSHVICLKIEVEYTEMKTGNSSYNPPAAAKDLGRFSDFKILCRGMEFTCQKVNVAKILFRQQGTRGNVLSLDKWKPLIVKSVLDHLYFNSKHSDMSAQDALELLEISHVYDLPLLKRYCEVILAKKMTMKNMIPILHNAKRFKALILEEEAKQKVKYFSFILISTKDFTNLVKAYPDIFEEE